jgi:hypothetical protein
VTDLVVMRQQALGRTNEAQRKYSAIWPYSPVRGFATTNPVTAFA